jgi:hypothetical protein
MASLAELVAKLEGAVEELHAVISGSNHGVLQGTHEAVLAEAQGAQLVRNVAQQGATFNHFQDLENTAGVIIDREQRVLSLLGRVGNEDRGLMVRTRTSLQPLLELTRRYLQTMEGTRNLAADLVRTQPTRLAGVQFGSGGLGTEVVRGRQALISTQMQQMATQLRARGIQPTLVPNATATARVVIANIRQLPITLRDAASQASAALTAARLALTQAARTAASSAASSFFRSLAAAMEAIVAGGSQFISIMPVLDPRALGGDLHPFRQPDST